MDEAAGGGRAGIAAADEAVASVDEAAGTAIWGGRRGRFLRIGCGATAAGDVFADEAVGIGGAGAVAADEASVRPRGSSPPRTR